MRQKFNSRLQDLHQGPSGGRHASRKSNNPLEPAIGIWHAGFLKAGNQ